MEDAAPDRPTVIRRRGLLALAAAFALTPGRWLRPAAAEEPARPPRADLGTVWGRLLAEEESPEGSWTPLGGVDVRLLPDPRPLAAELERIRQLGRSSWRDHDQVAARIQAALEAHEERAKAGGEPPRRQTSDAWGLFRFDEVPAGDWLLVAIRITAYRRAAETRAAPSPTSRRRNGFLERPSEDLRDAEMWLTPVRVDAGAPTRAVLTDRARWTAGPIR
jgi:hypothetical protein